jgi:hypothetical protein
MDKEKMYLFHKIYCNTYVYENMLNEGNQIQNFISSSGSGTIIDI